MTRADGHEADTTAGIRGTVTWEFLIFLLIMVAAIFSRFWGLGDKTLHHDESLHAYYSWVYYIGDGYRHDPLMHGPFLFHANALAYFLFGDSDATSRYVPALFGVILVGLPWLLRGARQLGRAGALAASAFLLVSPSILYQSRYLRHDIYTLVGALALFICIVRYVDRPERRWLIGGAAMIAFLLTNHEIVFAILVIFFGYLYASLFAERVVAWKDDFRSVVRNLVLLHMGALIALMAFLLATPSRYTSELLDIPWQNPTRQQQTDYWERVATSPFILGLIALLIFFLLGLYLVLRPVRNSENESTGWIDSLLGDAPRHSVSSAIQTAWADKQGLTIAVFAAFLIFVPLYTSLFTNMDGLISSTVSTDGTLLYWLGQQDYRRGSQPWFYFILLMPQYEFLAVVLGSIMSVVVAGRAIARFLGRPLGNRFFMHGLLVTWFAMIFLSLSYAGEKMPWLVVHIALPGVLLAAAFSGNVLERAGAWKARVPERRSLGLPELAGGLALVLLGIAGLGFADRLTYGEYIDGGVTRVVTDEMIDQWWMLALPAIAAVLLLAVLWARRGPVRAGFVATFATIAGLFLLQIHVGWGLSYYTSDVPIDMLVYTQSSPDIKRIMAEIDQYSAEVTGGKGLEIVYDSETAWPMQWYLRQYQNKRFGGASIASVGEAPIILAIGGVDPETTENLSNYTSQDYVLRWWYPEEIYRDFAIAPELSPGSSAWEVAEQDHGVTAVIGSVFDSFGGLFDIESQQELHRLVMFRELEQPIGRLMFRMYIRNDILPEFNDVRY